MAVPSNLETMTREQLLTLLRRLYVEEERRAELAAQTVDAIKTQIEDLQTLNEAEDNRIVKLEYQKQITEKTILLNQRVKKDLEEKIKSGEEINKQDLVHLKMLQAQEKAAKAIPSLMETFFSGDKGGEKLMSEFSSIGSSITKNFGESAMKEIKGIDLHKSLDDALESYATSGAGGGAAGITAAAESLAMAFSKAFAAAMVFMLAKYTEEAIRLASSLADMEAGFMKATGAGKDYARIVTNAYVETRKFGATAEETSKAAQDLYGTFTDFTLQSVGNKKELIKTTALLKELGIDSQTTAKSIQFMTKSMGMSPGGAARSMLNLEKFAENLGVPVSQLGADFAASASSLAKLGSNGEAAFKRLAIAAKTTGLEMQKILNITNKFDTFEGAATQAGKLNAALGGNFVNAMDLMMATDPAERFDLIRDSILDAGLSFDSMSYYQRKFYADSLGLSDVNDLALILSGNMDMVAGATQQSSQSIEDAAKRAREMATLQEKLNILFAQMIPILTPVIDLLSGMAGFFADNADIIKPLIGLFLVLSGAIMGVLTSWSGAGAVGGGAAIILGFGILFDSIETGTESVSILGEVFAGIMMPFEGVWWLLSKIGGAIISVGKKFRSLLASVAPAFPFFKGFALVMKGIGTIIGTVLLVVIGLLTAAMVVLAAPFIFAAAKIGLVVAAVSALAALLFSTPFNPPNFLQGLFEIADGFLQMAKMAMEVLNPFNLVARAIENIGATFSAVLGGITGFFALLASPEAAKNILGIAEAVNSVSITKAAATAGVALASGGGTNNAATSGGTNKIQQPIQIEINGNKLAEFVLEVTGERLYSVAALQK